MTWPAAEFLDTTRFVLEPLSEDHADEMVDVLASRTLYDFTGGEPPTMESLRTRYVRQSTGESPDGDAGWLNWIIRTKASDRAIGFIQATLTKDGGKVVGELAWLVSPQAQGNGAAVESSAAVLAWLKERRVQSVKASIRPDHAASARVAQRIGLSQTPVQIDGETLWEANYTET
jgi:RimJ/RimL family protein N-acetyltransferase